jgi:citronellol/citronellal dehydrogenase
MQSKPIFRDDMLAGTVALVTGGGTGIGAEVCRELARCGATVHIASRKAERIVAAARALSDELGVTVHGHAADIRDRDQVRSLVAAVLGASGRLDLLVNNGGGQFLSPAEAITDKGWDAVISTNLTGTWNCTRAAVDAWMGRNGGRVVNITMNTRRTFPGMAHSVAARAGVEALTRTLAIEWASKGILLNCVAPGLIASSGMKRYPFSLDQVAQLARHVPLKRYGTVSDVARAVAWLAGPGGDYVTGQVITVDGGRELWGDWWAIPDPAGFPPALDIAPDPGEEPPPTPHGLVR